MKHLFSICLALIAFSSYAQIHWLERSYDFGHFPEEGGPRRGEVRFVNTGTEPTIINRVKSTCGCTVAGYTEDLIQPGDTATVWFTYNPAGRPGRFEKSIKVYTGSDNAVTTISLRGTVIGSDATLQAKYPVQAGPMRLSASGLDLGKSVWGKSRHEYISGYNQSPDTLHLSWDEVPKSLSVGVSSKTIAPGDLFTIGFYLNTRDIAEPGPFSHTLVIHSQENDSLPPARLLITADIVPDTSSLSEEQLRQAPNCQVSPAAIDLGNFSTIDKPRNFTFTISNDGHSPLHISRICIPGSQALRIKTLPSAIKPGKSAHVTAELLPQFLHGEGPFSFEVQVISDDPLHPSRSLKLVGILRACR